MKTRNKPSSATAGNTIINNYYTSSTSSDWLNIDSIFLAANGTVVNTENVGIGVEDLFAKLHCLTLNIGTQLDNLIFLGTTKVDVKYSSQIFELSAFNGEKRYLTFNNNEELVIYTSRP